MREDLAYQLHQAIQRGDSAELSALLNREPRLTGTPIPVERDWGEEMWLGLHLAAESGRVELVGLLLDASAAIDARTRFRTPMHARQTALMIAAGLGLSGVAALLIERGANLQPLDANHRSALSHAAAGGHAAVVNGLLAQGAPLDPIDDQQRTPLHWAICSGDAASAIALIEAGADVNHLCPKEPNGYTPLHRCASAGHGMDAVAQRLRQAGADTRLRDPRNAKTADELAQSTPA